MSSFDRSSQIVEDIKWTLFSENEDSMDNSKGFNPSLKFVAWCGDSESFIVSDGNDEYKVTVTKI